MLNGGKHLSYPNSQHSPPGGAQHSPSSIHMHSNGQLIMAPPPLYASNYKTVQTDDPVERRRLNFPTAGLFCLFLFTFNLQIKLQLIDYV